MHTGLHVDRSRLSFDACSYVEIWKFSAEKNLAIAAGKRHVFSTSALESKPVTRLSATGALIGPSGIPPDYYYGTPKEERDQ
jgi:hypothetical protein